MSMEDIKETVVNWPAVRIIVHSRDLMKELLVDPDELTWNIEDGGEPCLSLEEIANQLEKLGHESPYYVWYELGLSGTIYLYGNYYPKEWQEHGTTRGYA